MWEQIRSNKRKSAALVVVMALILIGLGIVIGEAYVQGGGFVGLVVAFAIWAFLSLIAYFQGDNILLAVSGAKKIGPSDHPELFNIVEEMKIASGLPKMPDIYIINDDSMNAFAAGRKPEKAIVAVTSGLLARLSRDELQGVVAHEVAHIINRDVLLMTMVSIMLGAIVMIAEIFLRSLWYGGGRSSRRYSSDSKGGGQAQAIMMVIAIVLAILAPILAQLIYFAISRKREYLADANGALLTRYPEGLASALEKLGSSRVPVARANKATASMYIVNPFAKVSLRKLTSTHPPTEERIRILRGIGGNVSYNAYQAAWGAVSGKKAGTIPGSAIAAGESHAVRAADPRSKKKSTRQQARDAGDLLRKVNQFIFLPCVCGLRVKLPPDYKHDSVDCPKCQRTLTVPVAQMAAIAAVAENLPQPAKEAKPKQKSGAPARRKVPDRAPLRIQRKSGEWMSFKCTCGKAHTLSPGFSLSSMTCDKCERTIEVN